MASEPWRRACVDKGEVLRKLGIDPGTASFGGGAGGSRSDLVTPGATMALLKAMAARRTFPLRVRIAGSRP